MEHDAAGQKDALRRRFAAYRSALSPAEHAARSAAIVERLLALPELERARTVHCFWPVLARREVDVRPLLEELRRQGKQIVLPVVVTFSRKGDPAGRLRHVRYEGAGTLAPNRWGIEEPTGGAEVPLASIEAVVVPAFGAGRGGHRVGHGFGYYDALLRGVDAPALCPVYAACLVDAVPAEAHDVAVDVLVTEDAVFRPA